MAKMRAFVRPDGSSEMWFGDGQVRNVLGEEVDHPEHYGGAENPYEAIKVIDAWQLGFCLGNTVKYIARAGKKGAALSDLKKARWYLDHEIELREHVEPAE